ncbi:MAG: SIP domain-containing protein [Nannocystaceae bacterium]
MAKPGQDAGFLGPGRSMAEPRDDEAWALVLGDETTLGLARALLDVAAPMTHIHGALECAPNDLVAIAALDLPLEGVARQAAHGEALATWLQTFAIPAGPGRIWLSGEADMAARLRDTLVERGVDRSFIQFKPYRSTRGTRHRKAVAQGFV